MPYDAYRFFPVIRRVGIDDKDKIHQLRKSDQRPLTNLEHIVPVSVIRKYTTRHAALADLHNQYLSIASVNSARSNYRFNIYNVSDLIRWCDSTSPLSLQRIDEYHYIDHQARVMYIPQHEAGMIARAVLHMKKTWGIPTSATIVGGSRAAYKWNLAFPVHKHELIHNYIVYDIQRTFNSFICISAPEYNK